jgi:hypothetical protein
MRRRPFSLLREHRSQLGSSVTCTDCGKLDRLLKGGVGKLFGVLLNFSQVAEGCR